ncbi:MAG: GNAT family N-acetyltransferase [Thermoplasmatota archaeon]
MFEIGQIRFRAMDREDIPLLVNWESEHQVTLFSRGEPIVLKNRDDVEKEYEENLKDDDKMVMIVELIGDDKAVGIATVKKRSNKVRNADIGTYIGEKDFWNKGLGTNITLGLCEMLFVHKNYDRISAWSSSINKRAHKVLERLGFKKTGVARKSGYLFGNRMDWVFFDLLKEEYMEKRDEYLEDYLEDKVTYLKRYCGINFTPKK